MSNLDSNMAIRKILLLGDPRLYEKSEPVAQDELTELQSVVTDLHDTMSDFRERYGAGRAIAAPQIGVFKRLIYMHIDRPVIIINPALSDLSEEMIELWDDCMSFPDLLVKVRRHKSCTIRFRDLDWQEQTLSLTDDISELLQHEYDHLDGVLAVQRAIDDKSFALRSERGLLK